jgi:protocatechuate 3,4-dioxygenase alpha subunit
MSEPETGLGCTPSQTVGPFFAIVLPWTDGCDVATPGTPDRLTISGRILDGAGDPVPDAILEVWQADPDGRFNHPDDPRGAVVREGFRGFGRCPTDADGGFRVHTVKPGPLPDGTGGTEAPHLDVSVLARGLLNRLITRIYFPDEAQANAEDPVLRDLTADERGRLTAGLEPDGSLRFDIRLQGDEQTPFFAI